MTSTTNDEETPIISTAAAADDDDDDDNDAAEAKRIESYLNDLEALAAKEEWGKLLDQINNEVTTVLPREALRHLGGVLGIASASQSVPLELFTTVIQVAGNHGCLWYTDDGRRTPFHMVLMHLDRPDITKVLLDACPRLVHFRDVEGLRGIDILTQRLLMMDERMRYLKQRTTAQALAECMECARLVTIHHHHGNNNNNNQVVEERDYYNLPMLHACCLARSDVPLALLERTIRRCGSEQACLGDATGNTPLHYAAAYLPAEETDDLLPRVLRVGTRAAAMKNLQGEYPIDLAIQHGRRWNTGCQLLLEAHPPAILAHQAPTGQSAKTVIYYLTQMSRYTAVFEILRAKPEILL